MAEKFAFGVRSLTDADVAVICSSSQSKTSRCPNGPSLQLSISRRSLFSGGVVLFGTSTSATSKNIVRGTREMTSLGVAGFTARVVYTVTFLRVAPQGYGLLFVSTLLVELRNSNRVSLTFVPWRS